MDRAVRAYHKALFQLQKNRCRFSLVGRDSIDLMPGCLKFLEYQSEITWNAALEGSMTARPIDWTVTLIVCTFVDGRIGISSRGRHRHEYRCLELASLVEVSAKVLPWTNPMVQHDTLRVQGNNFLLSSNAHFKEIRPGRYDAGNMAARHLGIRF